MFPARATAETLIALGWEVRLITDARGQRHTDGFPAVAVDVIRAASPSTKNPIKLVKAALELTGGVAQTRKIMMDWRPDVVAGFGGYPAFPALAAAQSMRIPFAIHEQNAVLGRVNRVFAGQAAFVASGFDRLDRVSDKAKRLVTGNPLRTPIVEARQTGYTPPAAGEAVRLLVLGGSLGARLLSETVPQAVAKLPESLRSRLDVVQQTREESLPMAREIYSEAGVRAVCEPFFERVGDLYADAHFVISRAGASSVSEIAGVGRPALFCPLGIATDDHQSANAEGLVQALAADCLPEARFTVDAVAELLETRLSDPDDLAERARAARSLGRPDAAETFAKAVNGLMRGAVV